MNYLCFDIGGRRTGIATGDDVSGFVSPVDVVEASSDDHLLQQLAEHVRDYQPDAIVIGLPLNMDGSDSGGSRRVRELADAMRQRFGCDIHLHDERLTSFDADQQMARSGRTHLQKKKLRDALAAAAILRDYLAARREAK